MRITVVDMPNPVAAARGFRDGWAEVLLLCGEAYMAGHQRLAEIYPYVTKRLSPDGIGTAVACMAKGGNQAALDYFVAHQEGRVYALKSLLKRPRSFLTLAVGTVTHHPSRRLYVRCGSDALDVMIKVFRQSRPTSGAVLTAFAVALGQLELRRLRRHAAVKEVANA